MIKLHCQICEKEFLAREVDIKRGYGKFCSLSCSAKFRHMIQPETKITKVCTICGREYLLNKARVKASRYCSRKCLDEGHVTTGEWKARKEAFRNLPNRCNRCTRVKDLLLHHRNGDHWNNLPSNWEILCRICHGRHHKSNLNARHPKIRVKE